MVSLGSQWQWVSEKTLTWPAEISEYLQKWILELRSPAFLLINPEGKVVADGGDLSRYGLADLREGDIAVQQAYFLEGLLPLGDSSSVLSSVETAPEVFADIHLIRTANGDCTLFLDATQEVTERAQIEQALRQTEEQLRQAEKMEALGRLAGGVAHDFNNLLTVILGYSENLLNTELGEKSRIAAREIRQAADRAAEMTRRLLSFSRHQARHAEVLDLNKLISGLQPLLRRLIGEDFVLTTILDSSLALVEVDRGQMEQVLINLAANARDAMPMGGPIEIRTANIDVDVADRSSHRAEQLHRGPHVGLSVIDTGCGMDADTMARAFEPFFTSKESGKGTGLGLAIVYGIIAQSGGEIFLTSEVGKGTRVEILLPAVDKAPLPGIGAADKVPIRGTETVLLVEDEDAVRQLVHQTLTELGYSVLEFDEPFAALALCERHSEKVDLLVTDFIMPSMNGRELAKRIVASHPETRVLYMSGYAKESFSKRGLTLPGSVFLAKPFTPGILADRVREALGRPVSI